MFCSDCKHLLRPTVAFSLHRSTSLLGADAAASPFTPLSAEDGAAAEPARKGLAGRKRQAGASSNLRPDDLGRQPQSELLSKDLHTMSSVV